MALISFQGFDGLNSAADLVTGPFSSATQTLNPSYVTYYVNSANARGGVGKCVGVNVSVPGGNTIGNPGYLAFVKGYNETISAAIIGCALQLPTASPNFATPPSGFLGFMNAGVFQCYVTVDQSGAVKAYRGVPGSGTLLGTSGSTVSPTSYNYMEVQAVIGTGTSGSITVRSGGATILTVSGVNTSNDSTVNLTQGVVGVIAGSTGTGISSADIAYFDDLVLLDTTGGAPANTFLGDVRVQTVYPTGAGALTQWTPLTSTNWSQVSETAMDSDTSYTVSGTNGQIDLFTQGGISVTPLTIFAVKIRLACRLDSAGGDTVAGELRSASTNYVATAQPVLSTYSYLDFIWALDPGTGIAWTKTGVNAAQIGYNRVS
jgi:hypothetical protein